MLKFDLFINSIANNKFLFVSLSHKWIINELFGKSIEKMLVLEILEMKFVDWVSTYELRMN